MTKAMEAFISIAQPISLYVFMYTCSSTIACNVFKVIKLIKTKHSF